MVLGEVEETVTVVEVDEETYEEMTHVRLPARPPGIDDACVLFALLTRCSPVADDKAPD